MAVFLRTESCCGLLSNSANSEYAATSTCVDVQKILFLLGKKLKGEKFINLYDVSKELPALSYKALLMFMS